MSKFPQTGMQTSVANFCSLHVGCGNKNEKTIMVKKTVNSKSIQLSLGIGVSVVCLWLALRSVPFHDLGQALAQANYLWLVPALVLMLALNLIRSEIWRILLKKRVSVMDAFWAYSTGFLFNNILPFRLGEAARVTVLATHRRLPIVEVAATAGLERLLDVISIVAILLAVLPFMEVPVEVKQGAILFGTAAVMGFIGVFVMAKLGDRSERLLRYFLRPLPHHYTDLIVARWQELVKGLMVLTQPSIGIPATIGALLVWVSTAAMQWSILRAFQPLASPVEATFMVVAVSLAIAVPNVPGFIGVYQWAGQQALVVPFPEHYTASSALAIAIVTHLLSYLLSTALGMIGLWYFGHSFAGLRQKLSQPSKPTEVMAEI